MSLPERPLSANLGDAHLNVAAFLMEIDERHGIRTVPEATRLAVRTAIEEQQQKEARAARVLGGLGVNKAETAIL